MNNNNELAVSLTRVDESHRARCPLVCGATWLRYGAELDRHLQEVHGVSTYDLCRMSAASLPELLGCALCTKTFKTRDFATHCVKGHNTTVHQYVKCMTYK